MHIIFEKKIIWKNLQLTYDKYTSIMNTIIWQWAKIHYFLANKKPTIIPSFLPMPFPTHLTLPLLRSPSSFLFIPSNIHSLHRLQCPPPSSLSIEAAMKKTHLLWQTSSYAARQRSGWERQSGSGAAVMRCWSSSQPSKSRSNEPIFPK